MILRMVLPENPALPGGGVAGAPGRGRCRARPLGGQTTPGTVATIVCGIGAQAMCPCTRALVLRSKEPLWEGWDSLSLNQQGRIHSKDWQVPRPVVPARCNPSPRRAEHAL